MMLKKRSRTINSKQGLMSDHSSPNSPSRKFISKPTVSLISATLHHFISETKHRHSYDVRESKTAGLGIILNALINEKTDEKSSNLDGLVESSHSLIEFGVNNKSSQLAMATLLSPSMSLVAARAPATELPPPILCISTSEMEKSEDYTRVVSHGPNPRTIHIFDTCIMEKNCCNGFSSMRKDYVDFLAFCNSCKKKLGLGNDIFMYRGEVAFCSQECRNKRMLFDDRTENSVHCESLASP